MSYTAWSGRSTDKLSHWHFASQSTDGNAPSGAKEHLIQIVIRFVFHRWTNIDFTLSDKDISEINGSRAQIPWGCHQLRYWHAVTYTEKRLTENKPPATYCAIQANSVFSSIDLKWVPGVNWGWIESGVHVSDVEANQVYTNSNQDSEGVEPSRKSRVARFYPLNKQYHLTETQLGR